MTAAPRGADDGFVDVGALDEFWEGVGCARRVNGRDVALFRIRGRVWAIDDLCSHGAATLHDGLVEGHDVECPLHQGRIDVRYGIATLEPCTEPVCTHAVRIVDGRVQVRLATSPPGGCTG